jgi:hypothetical protein
MDAVVDTANCKLSVGCHPALSDYYHKDDITALVTWKTARKDRKQGSMEEFEELIAILMKKYGYRESFMSHFSPSSLPVDRLLDESDAMQLQS